MPGYVVESGLYDIEGVGRVHINLKTGARNVCIRWKGAQLYVSAPRGADYDKLRAVILDALPTLQQSKPAGMYEIGQKWDFGEFSVEIASQQHLPDKILLNYRDGAGTISVGTAIDINSQEAMRLISSMMCRIARHVAPGILLPMAQQEAARVGRQPLAWEISNGHRVLGHCNARGVIALSCALVFYPPHLRQYVVCHELAHLSEMNHSPRFHAICDSYCGGRESALRAEFRATHIPLLR